MTRASRILAAALAFTSVTLFAACSQEAAELPGTPDKVQWAEMAIGYEDPGQPQLAALTPAADSPTIIKISGSGTDIWDERDEFYFVYTSLYGDGSLSVRLHDFSVAHAWSKAGVMIRESLEPDARNVLIHISGQNGSVLQARLDRGASTTNSAGSDPSMPIGGWMRLTRSGDQIVGELSTDGATWRELGRYTLPMGQRMYIGLAVTAHAAGQTATASFSNLEYRQGKQEVPADPGPKDPPSRPSTPNYVGTWVCPDAPLKPQYTPTYFVSTTGRDDNDGRSAERPFRTLQRAANAVSAGDVVWVRSGTYSSNVSFQRSGTSSNPIVFESYPGECAILDGTGQQGHQNVRFEGANFNVFRNFVVRNNPAQGIQLMNSSDNEISHVRTHGNGLSGIQNVSGDRNHFSYFITHDNSDGSVGNADGIGLSSGRDHRIDHCVAYRNSDDGVDSWLSVNSVIERCVSFENGLQGGDGNGFKLGGRSQTVNTVIRYSISFGNKVEGFNYNSGSNVTLEHNTSYDNGMYGYIVANGRLRNNLGFGDAKRVWEDDGGNQQQTNSWNVGVTDPSFISTDPNSPDFLALSGNSSAIGKGSDIGLPYEGAVPDLGAIPHGHTLESFLGIPLREILAY